MTTRLKYIDIAKGIAIVCVVCGHVLIYDFYGFTDAWNKSPLVQFIYSFHMPLFFFLSGLVASPPNSVSEIPKDFIKRFRTLIMPFSIIGSIHSLTTQYDLSFFSNEMKYGYWYFLVLFYCYVINYISINKLKSHRGGIFVIQIGLLTTIWKIFPHLVNYMPKSVQDLLSVNQLILYFPYFLMSSLIKRFSLHDLFFRNGYVFILAAAIWGCSPLIHFPYSNFITTSAAILVIMNICTKIERQQLPGNRILEYIGMNTLYIYCFHYFALQLMKMPFMEAWLLSINPCIFLDLLLCLIPTVFAVLFSLFIKQIISGERIIMEFVFNKKEFKYGQK